VRLRVRLVVAGVLVLTGLCGCTPRPQVFLRNNTDQVLLLRARNPAYSAGFELRAKAVTDVPLLLEGQCTSDWLVYDKAGTTLVKDPGRFCGRQTITIP
jgi:hypothetical protein